MLVAWDFRKTGYFKPPGRGGGGSTRVSSAMYAVIATGGKQHRVSQGDVLDVELCGVEGDKLSLNTVMVVDGDKVIAGPDAKKAKVTAKIIGESKGPKIRGFKYKNKSNQRSNWGHRQHYSTIEIDKISIA